MSGAFIKQLPPEAQSWSALAVAGLIVADGQVTDNELELLRETISFLSDRELIDQIVGQVKNRELPKLPTFKCDRKLAAQLLMSLTTVALMDDRVSQKETEYFYYISGRLGFESHFAHAVLAWGKDFIKLNREKQRLLQMGSNLNAVYVGY